ncbi:hypothetical protein VNO77_33565 [Canavalia gladiata]|uniref:Low-temperature-induced 65 kDa protein n=1 Tax=Canavalia gladiata TaxID=3824 RepID=A0AAN9Q0W8_CANGL
MTQPCKGGKTQCHTHAYKLLLVIKHSSPSITVKQLISFSIMDPRAVQTHAQEHDEHNHNSHNVGLQGGAHGEEVHPHDHEKKSVLKKVKAKAKKIKDTITKHGHHDHEHGHEYHYDDQHIPDDHDLDEEDEEDEDMVEGAGAAVHGAPIYDSSAVRSAAPAQVNTIGRPGDNFGGTTLMREEPHHEPRVVVVSPTIGTNQSRPTEPTRTFVGGEKAVQQPKVNLERPMALEEDPHAPRSRPEAYAPPNYQTKVTDPTGAGGAEIDITAVEKSFGRMSVYNETKPNPKPKLLPTSTETQYPSALSHTQFEPELSTATKTHYPSAKTYGQHSPELSSEVKTQYPKSHDQFISELPTPTNTQFQPSNKSHEHYPKSHDQFVSELPTPTNTQFQPSNKSHDHYSATKTQYPSTGTHDQFGQGLITEPGKSHFQPSNRSHDHYSATKTQYPSTGTHDQFGLDPITEPGKSHFQPSNKSHGHYSATKTQYPSTGTHDQFGQDPITEPGKSHFQPSNKSHDHYSATKTQYPSTGTHDQFGQDLITEPGKSHFQPSNNSHDHYSATKTQYPSTRTHDQFGQDLITEPGKSHFQPSNKSHDHYSATETQYPSTRTHDQFVQDPITKPGKSHDQYLPQQQPSATNTQYPSAGSHDQFLPEFSTQPKTAQTNTTTPLEEQPSNQNSYTSNISSAIADKASAAKNAVASTLGYNNSPENKTNEKTRNQEETEKASNQSSYTEKISTATSAIADKAVSAKNTVASTLGLGEENKVARNEENNASSPTEYGKRVAQSLTEKLGPVYGKVAGVGSAVKSKVAGTGTETEGNSMGMEQDKGVSMKEYLVDKLRPGDDDRALSEVISETLHKKEPMQVSGEREEDRGMRKLVSDAVHKREEEPERRVEHRRPLGKVTESEEVRRRLGIEDEETEKMYEESYLNSPGQGVVDKLKGVVGSWFTKQEENQSSQGGEDSARNYGAGVEQASVLSRFTDDANSAS